MTVRTSAPITSTPITSILLVDDDNGHCELIRRNLWRAGVRKPIATVYSGEAALDHVRHAAGGSLLALLDINMPGPIDGTEVLRQLKSDPAICHVPVIMLTTTDNPTVVARCYELGCNVYLAKPVEPALFVEVIHRLGLFIEITSVAALAPQAAA